MKQLEFDELGANRHDAVCLSQAEGIQEDGLKHAHDGGVCADTYRNGRDRGGREQRLSTKQPAGES
jgi:hypothetical protein